MGQSEATLTSQVITVCYVDQHCPAICSEQYGNQYTHCSSDVNPIPDVSGEFNDRTAILFAYNNAKKINGTVQHQKKTVMEFYKAVQCT